MTFADEGVPDAGAAGDDFAGEGTGSAACCGGGTDRPVCANEACGVAENFALFPAGAFVFFPCATGGAANSFGGCGMGAGAGIDGDNEAAGVGAGSVATGTGVVATGGGCGGGGIGGANESSNTGDSCNAFATGCAVVTICTTSRGDAAFEARNGGIGGARESGDSGASCNVAAAGGAAASFCARGADDAACGARGEVAGSCAGDGVDVAAGGGCGGIGGATVTGDSGDFGNVTMAGGVLASFCTIGEGGAAFGCDGEAPGARTCNRADARAHSEARCFGAVCGACSAAIAGGVPGAGV